MSRNRSIITRVAATIVLLLGSACGGDGPTNPPPVAVSRVDVTASTSTLAPPNTAQLAAIARSAAGAVLDDRAFAWRSNAGGVATVNGTGLVTAVAPGTATISATSEGVTGSVTITVVPAGGIIATVTVSLSDPVVALGDLSLASVTAVDAGGHPVSLGSRPITWSSSNAGVVKITSNGVITAIGVGSANVTATVDDNGTMHTGSAPFTATAIAGAALSVDVFMPGLTYSPNPAVIKLGGTVRYVFPTDEHNVIWDHAQAGVPVDIQATHNVTIGQVFNTVGLFVYNCTIHPGMQGTVLVSP